MRWTPIVSDKVSVARSNGGSGCEPTKRGRGMKLRSGLLRSSEPTRRHARVRKMLSYSVASGFLSLVLRGSRFPILTNLDEAAAA